jgi:hypothetical protein
MAKPAASSAAELMRLPVDKRSIVLVIARSFWLIELAVNIAAEFELITVILVSSLKVGYSKQRLFQNPVLYLLMLLIDRKRQTFTQRWQKGERVPLLRVISTALASP